MPLKVPDMNDNDRQFISSLLHPEVYEHAVDKIELVETHISWVILTGPFAYKIKKPVNLGFLDFSTLEKRHFYCNEELRLNSRLAPQIYLDVVPISGTEQHANFSGSGRIIDYAIKMVQFPQEMQLDRLLSAEGLNIDHIDALALWIANFHQQTDIASKNDHYGDLEKVYLPIKENFIQLRLLATEKQISKLNEVEQWSQNSFDSLKLLFEQRKQDGFIRECHGDLHLRNLVFIDNKPVAFDCIEFDPELRWIDTINDIAFLIMDLHSLQQPDLAQRLFNAYLEITGDYSATQLLRFYLVYRALVRAKVAAISASQVNNNTPEQQKDQGVCSRYLELAQSYLQTRKPMLIITCGMSASGKTTLTQPLLEQLQAIRVRSDVERKRLFTITGNADSTASIDTGLYSPEITQQIYHHLAELAEVILSSAYPVIIDAACLKYEQRALFRDLAARLIVPFVIIEFTARPDTLRQRINSRQKDISDADQSVLEHQLANWQPLAKNELSEVITIDTESSTDLDTLITKLALYYKEHQ